MGLINKFYRFSAGLYRLMLALLIGAFTLGLLAAIVGSGDDEAIRVKTEHAVGVVNIFGEIFNSEKYRRQLKTLVENNAIKAIVVRIDSPGGSVGASEEIYETIRWASEKKPTVCSMGNVAASGGLYSAMGCGKIVSNRGTLTGSIGVVMMIPNVATIMDRFGAKMTVVKSGQFKDAGSPFRETTKEDRELLQSVIDKAYNQFVDVIAQSRRIDAAAVRKFADGRIIVGEEAKSLGLVDEMGGLTRAAKIALELAGDTAEPEIAHFKRGGIWAVADDEIEGFSFVKLRIKEWLSSWTQPKLLYLSAFE